MLAIGETLVISAAGIDLSIGSLLAFSGAVGAQAVIGLGLPWPVSILACLGAGTLAGAGLTRLATPTRRLHAEQIEEIRRSVPAWSPLAEDTLEIVLSHVADNASKSISPDVLARRWSSASFGR